MCHLSVARKFDSIDWAFGLLCLHPDDLTLAMAHVLLSFRHLFLCIHCVYSGHHLGQRSLSATERWLDWLHFSIKLYCWDHYSWLV